MRAALLAALCIAATGCANLPDLTPACGNGVLEPGEDCDTPGNPRCQQCAWTCTDDRRCTDIPAPRDDGGYACGADNVCHAPGGVIGGETAAPELEANRFMIADIDRDHIGDAVGVSVTSVTTRFGDLGGALARATQTLTRGVAGEPQFVDFDRDGTRDVLIAARDGLTSFASPQDVMSPFAIAFELPDRIPLSAHAAIPIDGKHLLLLVDNPLQAGQLTGAILDITTPAFSVQSVPLCDSTFQVTDFDQAFVSYYDTSAVSSPDRSIGVTFVAKNGMGTRELCGLVIKEDTSTDPVTLTPFTGGVIPAPTKPPLLARVDGSACPSLILSDGGPGGFQRLETAVNGASICGFAGVTSTLPAFPGAPGDAVVGRIPLVPPISGRSADALVVSSGVYAIDATTQIPHLLYTADRPLTVSAFGDINGDGDIDAMVAGDDDTLDVLYRNGDAFLRQRLATHAPPRNLTVGDFDGNRIADVAYSEHRPLGYALEVAYGTIDQPTAAAQVATFEDLQSLVPVALADSVDPTDVVDDLAVIDQRNAYEAVSPFHGGPDRSMVPFFDPRGTNPQSSFRAVVAGHFVPGSTFLDVLGIELADPGTRSIPAALWRLEGEDPGAVTLTVASLTSSSGVVAMPGVDDCTRAAATFCLDGARFLAWPTSGTDLLVGLDAHNARIELFDPGLLDYSASTTDMLVFTAGAKLADHPVTLRAAFPADLDGDGTNELVVAFEDGLLACHIAPGAVTCDDLVAPAALPAGCRDAAPGRFELLGHSAGQVPPPATELVVLCDSSVYRLAQGQASLLAALPLPAGAITAIEVGDVTGDAVDDLLVLALDPGGVRRLHVFPQQTSREADR